MPDFILFMHNDAATGGDDAAWEAYFGSLNRQGVFEGGSEIGFGECVRKAGVVPPVAAHITGFIRVKADDLAHARRLVAGNPVFEGGGTVEIRELPVSG